MPTLNSPGAFVAVWTESEITISKCAFRCVLLVLDNQNLSCKETFFLLSVFKFVFN